MSKKTLSTGTLSLRFMQNAYRSQNLAQVEPIKAEIHDDGKWEVNDEVKRAWGLTLVPQQSVTYEASYLPFLFPLDTLESSSERVKLRGRRTFKGGKEIVEEPTPPVVDSTPPEQAEVHAGKEAGPSSNFKRPTSISSIMASRGQKPNLTKSARETILSISDVGTDLHAGRRGKDVVRSDSGFPPALDERHVDHLQSSSDGLLAKTLFLKPSGVDEPQNLKNSAKPPDLSVTLDKDGHMSFKRERDLAADRTSSENKKRKKKAKKE